MNWLRKVLGCAGGLGLAAWGLVGGPLALAEGEAMGERASPGLVVWSWRVETAERIEGVTPMVWVRFNYGHLPKRVGTTYHTARPEHEIANTTLRQIDDWRRAGLIGQGELGLFYWFVGGTQPLMAGRDAPRGLFPEGHAGAALAAGGLTDHTEDLVRRVAQRLHLAGVEPDYLILDYEGGANRWQLGRRGGKPNPAAYLQDVEAVFAEASAVMPGWLREMGPAALRVGHPRYREAVVGFNAWADERRSLALRRAVLEPTYASFGRVLPSSNYSDQVRAWETFDLNGWPEPVSGQTTGTWSSPVTYVKALKGNRYRGLEPEVALARAWADQRDRVRAALAWSPDVAPWYSSPDDGRPESVDVEAWRWAWAAGLMHDRSLGVRRMLLWSNAAGWSEEEVAFARPVFAALHGTTGEAAAYRPNVEAVPWEEAEAWLAGWVERTRSAVAAGGLR